MKAVFPINQKKCSLTENGQNATLAIRHFLRLLKKGQMAARLGKIENYNYQEEAEKGVFCNEHGNKTIDSQRTDHG